MKDFTVHVRKDGAINIGKSNRIALGIEPGSLVRVAIDKGTINIEPVGYICAICGKVRKTPLSMHGYCSGCCSDIVNDIRKNKSSLDTAIARIVALNTPTKEVVHK